MAENKESDLINVTDFNESAVMSGLGVHSTPNVGQDNKISELNVTNESNVTDDSGIQLTPMLASKNKKPDEVIISEAGAKLIPVVTNIIENIIEQSISSIKDELSMAMNQKLNNITERVVITRDVNEIELETFCSENRRVHPMQFLNKSTGVQSL